MLVNLIRQHALADAEAGNWSAVAATLNALTTPVTDTTHWSFGLMMSQGSLPPDLVTGIASAVKTAAASNALMDSAFIAFSTTGLQLHTDERQAMIDAIGAGLPSEAVAAVKALGRRTVSTITTTAAACEAEWVRSLASAELNEQIQPAIASGDRATIVAALRLSADTLEAG
jgi:hypothetical protein